jgi:ATP-dependent protease HslVU (ClpYQ) peptidase subunit
LTTLAANKDSIACDLQVSWNGGYKYRVTTKIFGLDPNKFIPEPFYVGYAGSVADAQKIIEWLRYPDEIKRPRKLENASLMILTEKRRIITVYDPDPASWIEINEPFFSIGSGANFAQASMLAGLSPKEAVVAASKLDPHTGMGVKEFSL